MFPSKARSLTTELCWCHFSLSIRQHTKLFAPSPTVERSGGRPLKWSLMAEQGSSAQDPEPGDTISLEALSEEDLSCIANNPHYRSMLQDLLAPYIAGISADSHPVGAQDYGHGSDPTTRNLEAA